MVPAWLATAAGAFHGATTTPARPVTCPVTGWRPSRSAAPDSGANPAPYPPSRPLGSLGGRSRPPRRFPGRPRLAGGRSGRRSGPYGHRP